MLHSIMSTILQKFLGPKKRSKIFDCWSYGDASYHDGSNVYKIAKIMPLENNFGGMIINVMKINMSTWYLG